MEIAIIGLPFSGKTTIFNAATRGAAQVAGYSSAARPNIGVAKVPDPRLSTLSEMYRPEKTTHAEVTFIDLPAAPDGLGQTKGNLRRVPESNPVGGRPSDCGQGFRGPFSAG